MQIRIPVLVRISPAAAVIAIAAVAAPAIAEVAVLKPSGEPVEPTWATVTVDPHSGAYDITLHALYNPGGETNYTIVADGGETIDELRIDVPCWEGPDGECVPAGSPVIVRVRSAAPLGLSTVNAIIQTGDAETILAEVTTVRDIGSIEVEAMGLINAGRDIVGPITAITPDTPARGATLLQAGRDILGDMTAPNGILKHIAAGRFIGTPDDPVTIQAKYGVWQLNAPDGIYADVDTRINDGSGYLWMLTTDRFAGSLRTTAVGWLPGFWYPGLIEIFESFEGVISIDGGFADPAQFIELPANGFDGQIIFNAANLDGAVWDAPVRIGPGDDPDTIVLTGPNYDVPAEALGGGSIGIAPFTLHAASCQPAAGETVEHPLHTVRLRHYGPLTSAAEGPVMVQRRPIGTTAPYETQSGADYACAFDPGDANMLLVFPTGDTAFQPGFEYRLQPTAALRCDLPGQPTVAWAEPFIFAVEPSPTEPCPADLDGNGAVGVSDLLAILAGWGAAADDRDGTGAADLDGTGIIGVGDLLALLAAWGPC